MESGDPCVAPAGGAGGHDAADRSKHRNISFGRYDSAVFYVPDDHNACFRLQSVLFSQSTFIEQAVSFMDDLQAFMICLFVDFLCPRIPFQETEDLYICSSLNGVRHP